MHKTTILVLFGTWAWVLSVPCVGAAPTDNLPSDPPATLRVIDAATGAPLAGATAQFQYCDDNGCRLATVTAGADGVARFPLADRFYISSVTAQADGYVPMATLTTDKPRDADRPTIELALPRGAPVGGVVMDNTGNPVADARVEFSWFNKQVQTDDVRLAQREQAVQPAPRPTSFNHAARTDAHGRWRIVGVPDQFEGFVLKVRHPSFLRLDIDRESADVQALRDSTHRATLAPGKTLVGRLVNPQGQPVGGATVFFGDLWNPESVEADPQGGFAIAAMGPQDTHVVVSADGYARKYVAVTAGGIEQPETITLEPARRITGRVVDERGEAMAGAMLIVDDFDQAASPRDIEADSEGRFSIVAGSEPVRLTVLRRGFRALRQVEALAAEGAEDEAVVLRLRPELVVKGSVVDAVTGKQVSGGQVTLGLVSADTTTFWGAAAPNRFADGAFDFTHAEDRGPVRLRIEAPGYLPYESDVLAHTGREPMSLDVTLIPAAGP